MSPRSKKEYLEAVFLRYKKAKSKEQKTKILNEFCEICGYHRKHAIRTLSKFKRFVKPKLRKPGKPSAYNQPAILKALERIWLDASMPCSKRFVTIIPLWLPHYPGGLDLPVIKVLKKISAPTIDRVLKHTRKKYKRANPSTTKPGTLLRNQIPIKTNQWEEFRPGFLEADTVAHCGSSTAGEYVNTVDFVDIATGWTEQRAVWGKGETSVLDTTLGPIENITIPRSRHGLFKTSVFKRYQRRQQAVNDVVCNAFLRGISTREVAGALKPILGTNISASAVSRITKSLNTQVKAFHQRKILDEYQFLFLDGITISVKGALKAKKSLFLWPMALRSSARKNSLPLGLPMPNQPTPVKDS